MFANGYWGDSIRVPGSTGTGTSVDLTPIHNRLTAVETHNLSQQVTLDDLGLQLQTLRDTVQGGGGTSGDDPGLTGDLAALDAQVSLLRADYTGFKQQQETINEEVILLSTQANNISTQNSGRIDAVILKNNEQEQYLQYLNDQVIDAHARITGFHQPIIPDS